MPVATSSPWGPIQTSQRITEGIVLVSTASHGGYILSPTRVAQMPAPLRQGLDDLYFEEDCAWCFVVLAFPHEFSPALHAEAVTTCKHYFPEQWEAWTGTTLSLDESPTKRQQHWDQEHRHDWVVTSAWGDWHQRVPQGYVGVCTTMGGRRGHDQGPQRYFLVPKKDYAFPFAIDLTTHQEIDPITTVS